MKRDTKLDKLNKLLGLSEVAKEIKTKTTGKIIEVSEEEIQTHREMQGMIYYLTAPHLFQQRICNHCKEPFLVSRLYVSFCSYTCIRLSLAEMGIKWTKGDDLELLAQDPQVFNGNEPIWITKSRLKTIKAMVEWLETTSLSEGIPTTTHLPLRSTQENTSLSTLQTEREKSRTQQLSSTGSTTTSTRKTGASSSRTRKVVRRVK